MADELVLSEWDQEEGLSGEFREPPRLLGDKEK
jgi:hypothetical protein